MFVVSYENLAGASENQRCSSASFTYLHGSCEDAAYCHPNLPRHIAVIVQVAEHGHYHLQTHPCARHQIVHQTLIDWHYWNQPS
jgi:hypothetical protein